MPSTELQRVILQGKYRGQKAVATFSRRGATWELRLKVGDKSGLYVLDRRDKPCWTIALDWIRGRLLPAKAKPSRPRKEAAKAELRIFG